MWLKNISDSQIRESKILKKKQVPFIYQFIQSDLLGHLLKSICNYIAINLHIVQQQIWKKYFQYFVK